MAKVKWTHEVTLSGAELSTAHVDDHKVGSVQPWSNENPDKGWYCTVGSRRLCLPHLRNDKPLPSKEAAMALLVEHVNAHLKEGA